VDTRQPGARTLVLLGLAAAGALLFCLLIGPGLLSAAAPYWLAPHNDMAINVTGALAVLGEPWRFPLAVSSRLNAPDPVSIVYTDSVAWVVLTLKALGLGKLVSPYGLQLLLSYVLQPVAFAALLSALGVRRALTLVAGGLLALLYPAWLMRFGHFSLTAHWILLFALALSVAAARHGLDRNRILGFVLLGFLGPGIHPYFMPSLAILLAAAMGSELLQRREGAWRRVVVAGAAFAAAVALAMLLLGYWVGLGRSGGEASLGFYSMNLLGPFLPQGSALAGQRWTGGWFDGVLDPNGGQWFEGYNYLGAGILFVLAAGAVLALRRAPDAPADARAWLPRWGPLALGMGLLFLAAVGPVPYLLTHKLGELPKPTGALAWLAFFRAHGRFFWAVGYLGLALAIALLDRRASSRLLAGLLVIALGLQAADSAEMRKGVHSMFAARAPSYHPGALADAPQIQGRPWVFVPSFFCADDTIDRLEISQLSLIAVRAGGSSNATGTSRPRGGSCEPPKDLLVDAAPGDRRITAVLGQGKYDAAFARRTDCRRFLRGHLCGADLAAIPGFMDAEFAGTAPKLTAPRTILFNQGRKPPELASGWSGADPNGIWSDGPRAVLVFDPPPGAGPIGIELTGQSFALPPGESQAVTVSMDGRALATWQVERANWRIYRLTLPDQRGPVRLELSIPGAVSPGPADPRRLGIGVQQLMVGRIRAAP
jgi:hypothetical protein